MLLATVLEARWGSELEVAFLQLLHCSSSEVAAEVMLTLHDKTGVDDHAASRFALPGQLLRPLLLDDDDAGCRIHHQPTRDPLHATRGPRPPGPPRKGAVTSLCFAWYRRTAGRYLVGRFLGGNLSSRTRIRREELVSSAAAPCRYAPATVRGSGARG